MKLDEIFKRKWAQIRESIMPSEGIWYVIYLKPKWVLKSYKEIDFPDCAHVQMWESHLSHVMFEHYGVHAEKFVPLHYAFPRGRIVNLNPGKGITTPSDKYGDKWTVYYGKDLPGGDGKWKAKILSAFDLSSFIGRVVWKFDDHEVTMKEDVAEMRELIGKY